MSFIFIKHKGQTTMVKTNIRFLALSLLVPAVALAGWMPTKRDATHAFVGGTLAFVQNKVGYQGAGLVLAGDKAKLQDHAATALTAWTFNDGAVAAFFGKFHTAYIGQWANGVANQADTTVTLRDQTAATFGKIAVNAFNEYQATKKITSKTFTTAIDPFYAVATAQYLYANKASYWSSAQAAEQAVVTGYNAATTSSTDAAKK